MVVINSLTPGLCYSDFSRESSWINSVFLGVMRWLLGRTTEVGSRTLVTAIEAGKETHGEYMADSKIARLVVRGLFHCAQFLTDYPRGFFSPKGFAIRAQCWGGAEPEESVGRVVAEASEYRPRYPREHMRACIDRWDEGTHIQLGKFRRGSSLVVSLVVSLVEILIPYNYLNSKKVKQRRGMHVTFVLITWWSSSTRIAKCLAHKKQKFQRLISLFDW